MKRSKLREELREINSLIVNNTKHILGVREWSLRDLKNLLWDKLISDESEEVIIQELRNKTEKLIKE